MFFFYRNFTVSYAENKSTFPGRVCRIYYESLFGYEIHIECSPHTLHRDYDNHGLSRTESALEFISDSVNRYGIRRYEISRAQVNHHIAASHVCNTPISDVTIPVAAPTAVPAPTDPPEIRVVSTLDMKATRGGMQALPNVFRADIICFF